MTNEQTKTEYGDFSVAIAFVSSLEFRHWASIRHSDFVILHAGPHFDRA